MFYGFRVCLWPPEVCQEAPKADVPWGHLGYILLLGKGLLSSRVYSQCWVPQWAQRVPEGRQLWAGKQGLRSTLGQWLSCLSVSLKLAWHRSKNKSFPASSEGSYEVSLLKGYAVLWSPGKRNFFCSESYTPMFFSNAVCQQITWIWNLGEMLDEKNILPHIALTSEVADLFFKDITAPLGNGVLFCFLL